MEDQQADISIDIPAMLADLEALLSFPSLGGTAAEVDIQHYLADRWRAEGLVVDEWAGDLPALVAEPTFPGMEVARSQVIGITAVWAGTAGGSGRSLLINGHTDVVPPGDLAAWSGDPFIPRRGVRDGAEVVLARGSCDMKAGLVAGWAAVRALRAQGITLAGDVIIAPVVGEEDGGLGTFALIKRLQETGRTVDMCVIPEPTSLDLILANGGALTFRIRIKGAAVHASRRTEGVSAIDKFLPIMAALAELESHRNSAVDPLMQRWPLAYPISIGTIASGDWASTVPDLLTAEGRFGVALGESVEAARAEFEAAVSHACAGDPWLRAHPAEVQWWGGQFAPGRTDVGEPVIRELAAAHEAQTGRAPARYGAPYGSDLRLLSGLAGIPTVQYGPGDAAIAHSPDEYVPIDEVITCARVLAGLILRVCG